MTQGLSRPSVWSPSAGWRLKDQPQSGAEPIHSHIHPKSTAKGEQIIRHNYVLFKSTIKQNMTDVSNLILCY